MGAHLSHGPGSEGEEEGEERRVYGSESAGREHAVEVVHGLQGRRRDMRVSEAERVRRWEDLRGQWSAGGCAEWEGERPRR